MIIDSKDYRVPPDKKVNLSKWPTVVDPYSKSKKEYKQLLHQHMEKLSSLRATPLRIPPLCVAVDLPGYGRRRQGWRHPARNVRGQSGGLRGLQLQAAQCRRARSRFSLAHDVPASQRGRIGIFNRSYYEEVLVVRVHPEILRSQGLPEELRDEKDIWKQRYGSITDLRSTSIVTAPKSSRSFFTCLSAEQRQRFLARIDESDKNWKFSTSDIHERKYWKHYTKAYEDCVGATSTASCAVVRRPRRQ